MAHELAFTAIRQGDLSAAEAWKLLSPLMTTDDRAVASRVSDALRSWVWKALDRRRRDAGLREWIDLLNRVEGFLVDRFAAIAARIDVLVELLHESIAVADAANPEDLLKRKHVQSILVVLRRHEEDWLDRSVLMEELGLKPANTTRLMGQLVEAGWAEQAINGREALYRLSAEGLARARVLADDRKASPVAEARWRHEYRDQFQSKALEAYRHIQVVDLASIVADHETINSLFAQEWDVVGHEIAENLDVANDQHEADDEFTYPSQMYLKARC